MRFFYDFLIFGFLIADVLLLALLFPRKKAKRKVGIIIAFVLALLAWLTVFYGSFIEPRLIVINKQEINLTAIPKETLKIVFISDLHVGPYKQTDFAERVVEKINALNPDMILMGGDFVYGDEIHAEYLAPLKNLKAKYGKFAILGNHDYGELVVDSHLRSLMGNRSYGDFPPIAILEADNNARVLAVEKALNDDGIKILKNSSVEIVTASLRKFALGGVYEYWTNKTNVKETFKNRNPLEPKILLAHNPDIIHEAVANNVTLMLSGHTHGGQIRLPFIGSLALIPDKLGRAYDRGLFEFGKTQLFISSGIGETGPRARLFNPPEIVILDIGF